MFLVLFTAHRRPRGGSWSLLFCRTVDGPLWTRQVDHAVYITSSHLWTTEDEHAGACVCVLWRSWSNGHWAPCSFVPLVDDCGLTGGIWGLLFSCPTGGLLLTGGIWGLTFSCPSGGLFWTEKWNLGYSMGSIILFSRWCTFCGKTGEFLGLLFCFPTGWLLWTDRCNLGPIIFLPH